MTFFFKIGNMNWDVSFFYTFIADGSLSAVPKTEHLKLYKRVQGISSIIRRNTLIFVN